jgi:hypothetical protein
MKNLLLLLVSFFVIQEVAFSQSCLPEGITFTTQAQIDNFHSNYPGCTEIAGAVEITGDYISNLDGLSMVTLIGGGLKIKFNKSLASISGLVGLTSVGGDIDISWNESLASLTGLENLASVDGILKIAGHDILTSFAGLENLKSVGGSLRIIWNKVLVNFAGLNNLAEIGGNLEVAANDALTDFEGLDHLKHIGGVFEISSNDALTSLKGLEQLSSTGDDLWIHHNTTLISLTGLDNLTSTGTGGISIHDNNALTSLKGMKSLASDSIHEVTLYVNGLLSDCVVKGVCDFLSNPDGSVNIISNRTGCNSPLEILMRCPLGVDESNLSQSGFSVYPDPASTQITIETPGISSQFLISIFNLSGQVLLSGKLTEPLTAIDISWLPQGIYFVKLTSDDDMEVLKLIKK